MAQKNVTSLQWPMAFHAKVTFDDVGKDVVLALPPGFILTDAMFVVTTSFNGTTPTVSLVDNMSTPNDIIASAAATAGVLAMAAGEKGNMYPAGGKMTLKPVIAGGTATAGEGHLVVIGVVAGRQNEHYGNSAPA